MLGRVALYERGDRYAFLLLLVVFFVITFFFLLTSKSVFDLVRQANALLYLLR